MKNRLWVVTLACAGIVIISLSLFPRKFVVQGSSMSPLYNPGDTVRITAIAYGLPSVLHPRMVIRWRMPVPGDIIVFSDPVEGTLTMKRCVGSVGDTLTVRENYITVQENTFAVTPSQASYFARNAEIPAGHLFVLGDNPHMSIDSRHFGYISVESVVGKVVGKPHG